MKSKRAVLLALFLSAGFAAPAAAHEEGVFFLTAGPCFSGILDFARTHKIEVWRGNEIRPESSEDDIVMCTIGPCGATLFLRSTSRISVEREIHTYLSSEQARQDQKTNRLDKSPTCFAKRIVFEKNAR